MAVLEKHAEGSGFYLLDFADLLEASAQLVASPGPTVRIARKQGADTVDVTDEFLDGGFTPIVQNGTEVVFKLREAGSGGEQDHLTYIVVGICDADDDTLAVGVGSLSVSSRGRITA